MEEQQVFDITANSFISPYNSPEKTGDLSENEENITPPVDCSVSPANSSEIINSINTNDSKIIPKINVNEAKLESSHQAHQTIMEHQQPYDITAEENTESSELAKGDFSSAILGHKLNQSKGDLRLGVTVLH